MMQLETYFLEKIQVSNTLVIRECYPLLLFLSFYLHNRSSQTKNFFIHKYYLRETAQVNYYQKVVTLVWFFICL